MGSMMAKIALGGDGAGKPLVHAMRMLGNWVGKI